MCACIHSYRELKMGVVGKGSATITEVSGYVKKVSGLLGKATSVPIIGKISKVLTAVAGIYIGCEETMTINKIVACTESFYSERLLAKAVI